MLDRPTQIYDEATAALGGDILQASFWGDLKERFGWQVCRCWHVSRGGVDATAQVLLRRLGPGLRVGYLPRGPTGVRGEAAWSEFAQFARRVGGAAGTLIWRVDPDEPSESPAAEQMHRAGFHRLHGGGAFGGIQPRLVFRRRLGAGLAAHGDLGRHLRRAMAAGSTVAREGAGALPEMLVLLRQTAQRQNLALRAAEYYHALHRTLTGAGAGELFIARHLGRAVGAALIGRFGSRATYLIGASATDARPLLPGYRLQAEVIGWAESEGLKVYDLRGGPMQDPHHGLNRFKRLFGEEVLLAGERDLPLRLDYWLWRQLEPLRGRLAAWRPRPVFGD